MTNIYFDEDVAVHCLCKYFFWGAVRFQRFIKFEGILLETHKSWIFD